MRLRILLIVLVSAVSAQQQRIPQRSGRTPQGQTNYQDPNGLNVGWKFLAPQNQWRSHLEETQRSQREQSQPVHSHQATEQQSQLVQTDPDTRLQYRAQSQPQVHYQPDSSQLQYKTYSQPQIQQDANQLQYKAYSQPEIQQQQDVNQLQYKAYSQPETQQQPDSNQLQYNSYSQAQIGQPESNQVQHSQVPVQPQSESSQIQYKGYQQIQAPVETQPEANQVQYKQYQPVQGPVEAQPEINQIQYKTFTDAPSQLRQIVAEHFRPQRPHADPNAFIYSSNFEVPQRQEQRSATAELTHYEQPSESYEPTEQPKSRRDYSDGRLQGKVVYKEDYQQREQVEPQIQPQVVHIPVPIERIPLPPPPKLIFNKNVPVEIQQLLQYQSQLPYDVIANSITYRPKTIFLPKPLPVDAKGPYSYRSKVYYVNNDQYEPEVETVKPVQEDQRF